MMPFSRSHFMQLSKSVLTTLLLNTQPRLDLTELGLYMSVCGSQIMMPSTFAASPIRHIAPRLPGFSTASRIMNRELSFTGRSESFFSAISPIIYSPPVVSRYDIFEKTSSLTSYTSALSNCLPTRSFTSVSLIISGQKSIFWNFMFALTASSVSFLPSISTTLSALRSFDFD